MSKAVGACVGFAAFIAAGVAVFGGKDDKGFGVINEEKEVRVSATNKNKESFKY